MRAATSAFASSATAQGGAVRPRLDKLRPRTCASELRLDAEPVRRQQHHPRLVVSWALAGGGVAGFTRSSCSRKPRWRGRHSCRRCKVRTTRLAAATEAPYGSWESPITPEFITKTGVGLSSLKCDPDGTLYWLEARPEEGGRQVVCCLTPGEAKSKSSRGGIDVSPKDANIRSRVHEYGGAAFVLGPNGDGIIYSNFKDQRLYWQQGSGKTIELTPKSSYEEDVRFRFADAVIDSQRNRLICIREDHSEPTAAKVQNTLCAVPLDGSGDVEVMASGRDFYVSPRLSPDGSQLAWVCWDHPNMPWDETLLMVANLNADTGMVDSDRVVKMSGKATASMQPAWSPNGALHFVSDPLGWWNLYQLDSVLDSPVNLLPRKAELSGSMPPAGWRLGVQNYCFLPDGRIITAYQPNSGTSTGMSLAILSPDKLPGTAPKAGVDILSGEGEGVAHIEIQEGFPHTIMELCPSQDGKTLYFLGGDPTKPVGIYRWRIPTEGSKPLDNPELIISSVLEERQIRPEYISKPQRVEFPTGDGEVAYGYYYAPMNPGIQAPAGALPPLLVKAHGGPTGCASSTVNPAIQFWTTRGFAVLDVDYRGSTGLGRAYRERLKGSWGVVDVEDVCAGAAYLVQEKMVDPEMLAIDGVSAGGYTTLAALAFKDVFTAGCSMYGIGDLETLARDTHKFESRYLDSLVGSWPADAELYKARSPANHVSGVSCPILLLQGAEDKIVPPNQAEAMYEAAKKRGLPCALKIFPEEQHGFRRSENIQDALKSELSFFGTVFGFEPSAEARVDLDIANAKA